VIKTLLRKATVPLMGVAVVVMVLLLITPRAVHGVVATLVDVVNTSANPVPVNTPTHLGVPLGSFVSLNCMTSGTTCSSFRQFDASGNQSATDYTIPAGHTLIVTDAEWEAIGGTAGRNAFLNLRCAGGCAFVYSSRVVADSAGIASTADHLTSGVPLVFLPAVSVGDASALSYLVLRGYLVPTS
jgi:hypothetical protein